MKKLSQEIMNLPCVLPIQHCTPAGREMYQEGHKAARHQAVEAAIPWEEAFFDLLDMLEDLYRECESGNPNAGTMLRIERALGNAGLL